MRGAGDSGSRSGRGSVRSCRQFNMQSGSFESGRELANEPKIVVVLDGPVPAARSVMRSCAQSSSGRGCLHWRSQTRI